MNDHSPKSFRVRIKVTLRNFDDEKQDEQRKVSDSVEVTGHVSGRSTTRGHWFVQQMDKQTGILEVNYFNKPDLKDDVYDYLVLNVYAVYNNRDESTFELLHMVGWCRIEGYELLNLKSTLKCKIQSEHGFDEGEIEVSFPDNVLLTNKDIRFSDKKQIAARIITAEETSNSFIEKQEAYLQNKTFLPSFTEDRDEGPPHFVDIQYRGKQTPIAVVFASLRNVTMHSKDLENTMKWWLQLAKSNCGVASDTPMSYLQTEDKTTEAEIISELFTMPMRGMVYAHDRSFNFKHKITEEDQWMSILSFPNNVKKHASFDCEDGTITVLEIIHAFKSATFTDTDLISMQNTLKCYAASAVLGQLRVSDTQFVYHAYPLLLHKSWFPGCVRGKDEELNPILTILMETTNYMSAAFPRSTVPDTVDSAAADNKYRKTNQLYVNIDSVYGTSNAEPNAGVVGVQSDAPSGPMLPKGTTPDADYDASDSSKWRYVMHVKAPASCVVLSEVYGDMHSIYTCEGPRCNQEVQLSVYYPVDKSGNSNTIGINTYQILEGKQDKAALVHYDDVLAQDVEDMSIILRTNTPIALPSTPSLTNFALPVHRPDTDNRFVIKCIDETLVKNAVCQLRDIYKTDQSFPIIHTYNIDLFDNCQVCIVDVRPPTNYKYYE